MKNTSKKTRLTLNRDTVRQLAHTDLSGVAGGWIASGSQNGTGSVTCPPPKNGDGAGCVGG